MSTAAGGEEGEAGVVPGKGVEADEERGPARTHVPGDPDGTQVQLQARMILQQTDELEFMKGYRELCEQKLAELHPGISLPVMDSGLAPTPGGLGVSRLEGNRDIHKTKLMKVNDSSVLMSTIAKHTREENQLHARIKRLEKQEQHAEQRAMELSKAHIETKKALKQRERELSLSLLQREKLSAAVNKAEAEIREKKAYIHKIEHRFHIKTKGGRLLEKQSELNKRVQEAEAAKEEAQEKMQSYMTELRQMYKYLDEEAGKFGLQDGKALVELVNLRQRIQELEEERDHFQRDNEVLLDFIEEHKGEVDMVKKQLEVYNRDRRKYEAKLDAEALSRMKRLEAENEEYRRKQKEQIELLGGHQETLRTREAEVAQLSAENARLADKLERGEVAMDTLEGFQQKLKQILSAHIHGLSDPNRGLEATPGTSQDVLNYISTALKMKHELYSRLKETEERFAESQSDLQEHRERLAAAERENTGLKASAANPIVGHHEAERVLREAMNAKREAEDISRTFRLELEKLRRDGAIDADAATLTLALQEMDKEVRLVRSMASKLEDDKIILKNALSQRDAEIARIKRLLLPDVSQATRTAYSNAAEDEDAADLAKSPNRKIAALKRNVERVAIRDASRSPRRGSPRKTKTVVSSALRKSYPDVHKALSEYADGLDAPDVTLTPAAQAGTLQAKLDSLQAKFSRLRKRYH